jgi:hypothetical protein
MLNYTMYGFTMARKGTAAGRAGGRRGTPDLPIGTGQIDRETPIHFDVYIDSLTTNENRKEWLTRTYSSRRRAKQTAARIRSEGNEGMIEPGKRGRRRELRLFDASGSIPTHAMFTEEIL